MKILGVLMVVAGLAFGVYVGLWVCLIGGIVGIIEAVRATTLIPRDIAVNAAKILFAGAAGSLSAKFLVVPGMAMFQGK